MFPPNGFFSQAQVEHFLFISMYLINHVGSISWLVEWHSSAELVCLEEGMGAMGKANGLSSLEVAQLSAEASR